MTIEEKKVTQSADQVYKDLLITISRRGLHQGDRAIMYDRKLIFTPELSLTPSDVGYEGQRWARLIFQYIEPRSFDKFLNRKLSKSVVGYTFPLFAMHGNGNCLLALTAREGLLTAYSRACLVAPTGLMDMTLLCLIAEHFKINRIEWFLSSVHLSAAKSFIAFRNLGLSLDSEFGEEMKINPKSSNWNTSRWREKALLRKEKVKKPNLYLYKDYIRDDTDRGSITPDSLAKLGKLGPRGGLLIRTFLREEQMFFRWGSTHEYIGEDCWKWKSFSDPMVQLILAKFKIGDKIDEDS